MNTKEFVLGKLYPAIWPSLFIFILVQGISSGQTNRRYVSRKLQSTIAFEKAVVLFPNLWPTDYGFDSHLIIPYYYLMNNNSRDHD